jgi:hypothetical protein
MPYDGLHPVKLLDTNPDMPWGDGTPLTQREIDERTGEAIFFVYDETGERQEER